MTNDIKEIKDKVLGPLQDKKVDFTQLIENITQLKENILKIQKDLIEKSKIKADDENLFSFAQDELRYEL